MWNSSTFVLTANPHTMILLLFALFLSCQSIPDSRTIQSDLATLNLTCRDRNSCSADRSSDSFLEYNCHCGSFCRDIDTCCMDSIFRPTWHQAPRFAAKCLEVYGTADLYALMVDECGRSWRDDGFVRDMCSSNGQDRDDPFLSVPVTSLRTGITYKNYYCAVCNENPADGQVAFWNVEIRSPFQELSNPTNLDLKYDSTQYSWTMESNEGISTFVILKMVVPDNIQQKVMTCRSSQLVSECSTDWTDWSTAEKCSAYTALVSTNVNNELVRYKNPHCAICNFIQADAVNCDRASYGVPYSSAAFTFFVGLFNLEEEVKKYKCNSGMVYDALSKKCRTVRCPRNHILGDRKCVPKRS